MPNMNINLPAIQVRARSVQTYFIPKTIYIYTGMLVIRKSAKILRLACFSNTMLLHAKFITSRSLEIGPQEKQKRHSLKIFLYPNRFVS
jgi:hypothetical protein